MARDLQPCGTTAAYQRHRRRREDPCDDCKRAWREAKAAKVEDRRGAAVVAARDARPPAGEQFDQVAILEEVLSTLRGQLREAPPQSVAAIAKQVRDTTSELAQLKSKVGAPVAGMGGGVDDIAARRAEREARRRAASSG